MRTWLFGLVVWSGCAREQGATRVALDGVDAVWGGAGFCARTTAGLSCWNADDRGLRAPVLVPGTAGVRDVALAIGERCWVMPGALRCDGTYGNGLRDLDLPDPRQVVVAGDFEPVFCARHAEGVSCWRRGKPPQLEPALGRPARLLRSLDGDALCAIGDDGTRCFPIHHDGTVLAALYLPEAKSPEAIVIEPIGGDAWWLQDGRLSYGGFPGRLVVQAQPFRGGPLDARVTLRELVPTTVTPRPVELERVRSIAVRTASVYALDAQGVARVEAYGTATRVERIAGAPPTALFGGFSRDLFAVRDGGLVNLAVKGETLVVRRVAGVGHPVSLAADTFWACALDDGGRVACVRAD